MRHWVRASETASKLNIKTPIMSCKFVPRTLCPGEMAHRLGLRLPQESNLVVGANDNTLQAAPERHSSRLLTAFRAGVCFSIVIAVQLSMSECH